MSDKRCVQCKSGFGFLIRVVNSKGEVMFMHDTCVGVYLMKHQDLAVIFAPGEHDREPKVIDLMQRLALSLGQQKLLRTEGGVDIEEEEPVYTGPKLVKEITIDG